jgi:hypothetical protein
MSSRTIVTGTARIKYTPGAYLVGDARFSYDPDDDQSRHEAHQAACAEMRRQNGGVDPLAERLLGPQLRIRNGMVSRKGAGQ